MTAEVNSCKAKKKGRLGKTAYEKKSYKLGYIVLVTLSLQASKVSY